MGNRPYVNGMECPKGISLTVCDMPLYAICMQSIDGAAIIGLQLHMLVESEVLRKGFTTMSQCALLLNCDCTGSSSLRMKKGEPFTYTFSLGYVSGFPGRIG